MVKAELNSVPVLMEATDLEARKDNSTRLDLVIDSMGLFGIELNGVS